MRDVTPIPKGQAGMTAQDKINMGGRTVVLDRCIICGGRPPQTPNLAQHHVVYRSRGGALGPTTTV